MSEGRCIHDIDVGQCSICKHGGRLVWITSGGDCWHDRRDCEGLKAGWEKNLSMGLGVDQPRQVQLGGSATADRRECSVCVLGSGRTRFWGDSRAAGTRAGSPQTPGRIIAEQAQYDLAVRSATPPDVEVVVRVGGVKGTVRLHDGKLEITEWLPEEVIEAALARILAWQRQVSTDDGTN